MVFVAAIAAFIFGFQAKAPTTPPDRSGEPALKEILSWAKALDGVHIIVLKQTRDTAETPFYPDDRVDFWRSGRKFRVEISGYWGDSSYAVSDGKAFLSDSQSEYDPAVIAEAKESMLDSYASIKKTTEDLSPFFDLMAGPEALDKVVDKTAAIKKEANQGDDELVSYETKKLGSVRLFYREKKGSVELDRLEYDDFALQMEEYKKDPENNDLPDPGALNRHEIIVVRETPPSSLFDVKPPKGREVMDKRKKGR
jgi:hypothetical protein